MATNIYVGNLAWATTADDLRALFEPYGAVARAQVVMDRETGRSRGFGFVEMDNPAEAQKAIEALNGADHGGRTLTVNEAKPREERPRAEFCAYGLTADLPDPVARAIDALCADLTTLRGKVVVVEIWAEY